MMASRILASLFALRVTVVYCAALAVVTATLMVLGPQAHDSLVARMSTNLDNLGHGRLDTLFGSAFVTDGDLTFGWLPGLVCLLAAAELFWRSRRLILAFAVGHIGATLIVAIGLAVALHMRWLPIDTATASDVGVSYGAAAILGALTAAIPSEWRAAWAGFWLASVAFVAAVNQDFTSVGHVLALLLGILVAGRLGSPAGWTQVRLALFAAGALFGYLTLVGSSAPTAPIAGLACAASALVARDIARRRQPIADPSPA